MTATSLANSFWNMVIFSVQGDYTRGTPPADIPFSSFFVFLFIAIICGFLFLGKTTQWLRFSYNHKWLRRIFMFFMLLGLLVSTSGGIGWMLTQAHAKIVVEFPTLTTSAIKIGIYNLELTTQEAREIPEDQSNLFNCVQGISQYESTEYNKMCDKMRCMRLMPVPTRDGVISKIKDVQSKKIIAMVPDLRSCMFVDAKFLK